MDTKMHMAADSALEELIKIHNMAIGAMNDAHATVERIEDALRYAKASYAAAAKNEETLRAIVSAIDSAQRGPLGDRYVR